MIDVLITSYKEPNATLKSVNSILTQSKSKDLRVTVIDPFPEVENFLKSKISDKRFNFFLDPGEGKSYALNIIFQELGSKNKNDLFIMTDGDVHIGDNAIKEIIRAFEDKEVGCITGRPISIDGKETKYGYWANIAFEGIHKVRNKLSNEKKFFECSGYLFAIRKGIIDEFPLETSEDSIIPYLFWKKNYKIKYVPEAEVYVKNPGNWKDWLGQKIRNIKAHENLEKIAPEMPRTKSFLNEIKYGFLFALFKPRNLKQMVWTIEMFFARLYIYIRAFRDLKNQKYNDGWRGEVITESTKTLD